MEEMKKLKEAYDIFLSSKHMDPEAVQIFYRHVRELTGKDCGSWSCGGCVGRCRERVERTLRLNGLLPQKKNK